MTDRQIQIQYLVRKLRYKYKTTCDSKNSAILDNILWRSYGVVYPNAPQDVRTITREIEKRKAKKKRTNKYLREMADCYDELYFVTLTFSDEYMNNATEKTLHTYAQRWLNENCLDYYANSDYGKKNKRLHYHAIVAFGSERTPWKYGFDNTKKAKLGEDPRNRYRVSSYMLKLTNHATKLGTGKSFHKKSHGTVDKLPDWVYT